ncbi:hypothetical protein R1538_34740 [Rhizobium leguminosarum]|uniref:hypothetical protein n=1 Tax=Rhizobium leguminosarum TaxID=384 RepID=UPI00293DFA75|nr:hypothetical protein [Rhizobium leguminosarum]MDV4166210.1 hypothetical protein [Rhizobium leguminosarum]
MLSGFPASAGTDPDMAIRAYLMASGGIEHEALARAAGRFMRGEVATHNNAFAPSCAEFAEECRFQQMSIAAERRPRIEATVEAPQPKVSAERMKLLRDAANGSLSAKRELAKMFPDNPIIASAAKDQDDNQQGAGE